MSYRLTCECGRSYPIETRQSGQTLQCECGKTLQIPTMLKMKRLPLWEELDSTDSTNGTNVASNMDSTPTDSTSGTDSTSKDRFVNKSRQTKSADPSPKDVRKVESPENASKVNSALNASSCKISSRRLGLLLVAGAVFVVSVFFFCRNIPVPSPRSVFYKQITFSLDNGKKIRRDSTPITESDFYFYYFVDYSSPNQPTYPVCDEIIDAMVPFVAYQYFNYVRDLNLSDNFYENYDAIKTRRVLRLCEFGILALIALAAAMYAIFAKESVKQVGTMRGSDWR